MNLQEILKMKDKGSFESKWPRICPLITRLLKQENVQRNEWIDLFTDIHSMCLWNEGCIPRIKEELELNILVFIRSVQEVNIQSCKCKTNHPNKYFIWLFFSNIKQISKHEDDEVLLRTYINAWTKFLDQSNYLPYPFLAMEPSQPKVTQFSMANSVGNQLKQKQQKISENHVRKLMLDTWSKSIFSEIKYRLQSSAMKIIHCERVGEPFDSQLVIGVRESYGNSISINRSIL